jgi:hypothetical protein
MAPLPTISEEKWLCHKDTIRRLYLIEKKSLKEVGEVLQAKGLVVTFVKHKFSRTLSRQNADICSIAGITSWVTS